MVDKSTIKIEKWFGKNKQIAAVRTVKSHITNMFKGTTLVGRLVVEVATTSTAQRPLYCTNPLLSRASSTRWGPCTLISPSTAPLLREALLLRWIRLAWFVSCSQVARWLVQSLMNQLSGTCYINWAVWSGASKYEVLELQASYNLKLSSFSSRIMYGQWKFNFCLGP